MVSDSSSSSSIRVVRVVISSRSSVLYVTPYFYARRTRQRISGKLWELKRGGLRYEVLGRLIYGLHSKVPTLEGPP